MDLNREVNVFLAFSLIVSFAFIIVLAAANLNSVPKVYGSPSYFPVANGTGPALTQTNQTSPVPPTPAISPTPTVPAVLPQICGGSREQKLWLLIDNGSITTLEPAVDLKLNADPASVASMIISTSEGLLKMPYQQEVKDYNLCGETSGETSCSNGLYTVSVELISPSGQSAIVSRSIYLENSAPWQGIHPALTDAQFGELQQAYATRAGLMETGADLTQNSEDLSNILKKYPADIQKQLASLQNQFDITNERHLGWEAGYTESSLKPAGYQQIIASGFIPDCRVLDLLAQSCPDLSAQASQQSSNLKTLGAMENSPGNPFLASLSSPQTSQQSSSLKTLGSIESSPGDPLPDSFDWRNVGGKNYITPIQDQGQCGSCWAFASVAALEGKINAYYNSTSIKPNLSEQDLVSCDTDTYACNGGDPGKVIDNYFVNNGIAQETDLKYISGTTIEEDADGNAILDANGNIIPFVPKCSSKKSNWLSRSWKTDSSYTPITLGDDDNANIAAIKYALVNYGPVVVIFNVFGDFSGYEGGIYQHKYDFEHWQIDPANVYEGGHAVTIVGYGASSDGQPYWIVKNSWGIYWGECDPNAKCCKSNPNNPKCPKGYFRISMQDADSAMNKILAVVPGNPLYANAAKYVKKCADKDKDGYCYWGLGAKPDKGCPSSCSAQTIEDCDDSNKSLNNNNCGVMANAGEIDIASSPSGAEVYALDPKTGNYVLDGYTPINIKLPAGSQSIKISKDTYDDYTQTLNVTAGSVQSINATLNPYIFITVTSPNGGETWQGGSQQTVTWTSKGIDANASVTIELFDSNNIHLTYSAVSNSGSATIGIQDADWLKSVNLTNPSSSWKIKISAQVNLNNKTVTISGSSANYFTILFHSLTITSPSGGETWQPGSQQTVTWTSQNIDASIPISITLIDPNNNGNGFFQSSAGSGLATIAIPGNLSSGQYKLYINTSAGVNGHYIGAYSNYFTIASLSSRSAAQSVCGNGIIETGESCDMANFGGKTCANYKDSNGNPYAGGLLGCSDCQISTANCYTCGNGILEGSEVCDGAQFFGSYTCATYGRPYGHLTCNSSCNTISAASCCAQNCAASGGTCQNMACIIPSSFTVTSPNGGQTWQAGSQQTVTWTSQNIPANTPMQINLYDLNNHLINIVTTTNSGSATITVPVIGSFGTLAVPPNQYKISIGANVNGSWVTGYSANYFNIVAPPPDSCTDSDGGNNPNAVGYVSGYSGGVAYKYYDTCISGTNKLDEFICIGGTRPASVYPPIACAIGCSNGVCIIFSSSPPPSITSISPTSGPAGTIITIHGSGFGINNNLYIDNNITGDGSADGVTMQFLTQNLSLGQHSFRVQVNNGQSSAPISNTGYFTVTSPTSMINAANRFFASVSNVFLNVFKTIGQEVQNLLGPS